MAGFEELLVSIVSDFDDAGFKKLDRSTSMAEKATLKLSNSLKGLFVGIIGNIGVREIVDATVKMDSLRTSMNALAGSKVGGAEQIKFLREETNRLGQDFITTANAYKNLFSAGKGAGMSDSAIQGIFSGVLEAGTVLGSSPQQMQGALTALEQMISKGKVSTQELRLQLGNALPGAMQIAARAMKVTNKEFQKMLESGLDSQKFVTAFARQLHEDFGSKATEASHTLRAELAKLNNAVFDLKVSFLDGDAGKAFADVIKEIAKILNSTTFKTTLNGFSKVISFLLKNIRLIGGIAVILGIRKLISVISLLRLEFLTTTFAAGSLGAALQMDAGIASIKALTAASWALLAPWLRLIAILFLAIELIDTLRGKRTLTREVAESLPTAKEAVHSEKFQRQWINFKKGFENINPFHQETPTLYDSGNYNKDGSRKTQNNNIEINVNTQSNASPQQIAMVVKSELLGVLDNYSMGAGYA